MLIMQRSRLALCGPAAVIACDLALPAHAQQATDDAAVPALEQPELWLDDLRAFFAELR